LPTMSHNLENGVRGRDRGRVGNHHLTSCDAAIGAEATREKKKSVVIKGIFK